MARISLHPFMMGRQAEQFLTTWVARELECGCKTCAATPTELQRLVMEPAMSLSAALAHLPLPFAPYRLALASDAAGLRTAQQLRFKVFHDELGAQLGASEMQGLDQDAFDGVCDHLVVIETASGRTIGTYRLQSGTTAKAALGYYSEQEFDFAPYEPLRDQMLELGRACIDIEHRNYRVLSLLWQGIAAYAQARGLRYLVGCSSLSSRDEAQGARAWAQLQAACAPAQLCTQPLPQLACRLDSLSGPVKIPKLLSAYLNLGAQICSPPAVDRAFGSIDFLTWFDLASDDPLIQKRRARFMDGVRV
jgi:putative hemolysin